MGIFLIIIVFCEVLVGNIMWVLVCVWVFMGNSRVFSVVLFVRSRF